MRRWSLWTISLLAGCHLVSGLSDFTETTGNPGGGGAAAGGSSSTGGTTTTSDGGAGGVGNGGSGGIGGTTDGGGGVGGVVAELTDDELIARWFLDDASSAGGAIADASGNQHELSFFPEGNAAPYDLPMTGAGVGWTTTGEGGKLVAAAGSPLVNTLNNRERLMIELVMGPISGFNQGTRIVHLGTSSGDGRLALVLDQDIALRMNGNAVMRWPLTDLNERHVHHFCIDVNAAEEVVGYLDGMKRTDGSPTGEDPSAIGGVGNSQFVLGNRDNSNRSPTGQIAYAALYAQCLPSNVIAGHALRLEEDDDPR